jgi:hypothetical protein
VTAPSEAAIEFAGHRAGTVERPLYYLHIPKTAGSSLTRLLRDAFAVEEASTGGYLHDYVVADAEAMARRSLLAGHWGTLPLLRDPRPLATVCTLREPVARAWSHVTFLAGRLPEDLAALDPEAVGDPAGALFREPFQWAVRDFQARWLEEVPTDEEAWNETGGPALLPRFLRRPSALRQEIIAERATAALRSFAVAGPSERLDEVAEAISRLLGRWLPPPPTINAGPQTSPPPDDLQDQLAERVEVDRRLHELSHRLLDEVLERLPPLPPITGQPLDPLPLAQDMDERFAGTGWHGRVDGGPATGWHRWTGPGRQSQVRLPWRVGGWARLRLHVVSAVSDAAVAGLSLRFQGRPIRHRLEEAPVGCRAVAAVEADPTLPLDVTIESGTVDRLANTVTGERSDPAGLAMGRIELVPEPDGGQAPLPRYSWA